MIRITRRLPSAVRFAPFALAALLAPSTAGAETIVCRSEASIVKAITIAEDYVAVKTRFQFDDINLVPLLKTTISVSGTGQSCVVAYFSAVVKPLDNYAVFQVTLDGVPMNGHGVLYAQPDIPVVIDWKQTDLNQPRMVAHQFFLRVPPGVHTVTVNVAAGSGFDPEAYPGVDPPVLATVEAPVLSIHYR
jgi:hypothetical protein